MSLKLLLLLSLTVGTAEAMKPPTALGGFDRSGELAGPALLAVHGPVKLTVRTVDADVDIGPSTSSIVSARVSDGSKVKLTAEGGDRVELSFEGSPTLRGGRVGITVPAHSEVEVTSAGGSVAVSDTEGRVRARTVSGDVRVRRAQSCELGSISGNVDVHEVAEARIDTVSGDTSAATVGELRFRSTSGGLQWSGRCAAGCRIDSRTLSGDVSIHVADGSSFELRYQTEDGVLDDQAHLERLPGTSRVQRARARLGTGEGLVEAQSWHGNLAVARLR